MKYLGIDYGTKRIGVAVSDDTASLAFPLTTIKTGEKALPEILELIRKNSVEKVVLGESRDFKGEVNLVMKKVEQFKKDLEELSGLPILYQPEFLTSALASREGKTPKEKLDASAAALILQSFLDTIKK